MAEVLIAMQQIILHVDDGQGRLRKAGGRYLMLWRRLLDPMLQFQRFERRRCFTLQLHEFFRISPYGP
jgi:hypothetical protein